MKINGIGTISKDKAMEILAVLYRRSANIKRNRVGKIKI
jgi:hypothetical protein